MSSASYIAVKGYVKEPELFEIASLDHILNFMVKFARAVKDFGWTQPFLRLREIKN